MGDHRLPRSQARRTRKSTSQETTGKSVRKNSSKCFLKHKKEHLRLPTSVEGQHRLHVKDRSDDFRKVGTPTEALTPRSMEGTFFPTISCGMRSPITNKSQRKLTEDSGPYQPLLPVQHTRKTFWNNIGIRQNQLLAPWPRGEETSADILIKMLETPKASQILENKWLFWDDHKEANKQPTNSGKQCQGKLDLEPHKLPWLCEGSWLHDGKNRGLDMISSIYYKYIYKGGDKVSKWAKPFRDHVQEIDTGYENQPSYEESPVQKTDLTIFDHSSSKKMSNAKDIRFSKQDPNFVFKIHTPQYPNKASTEIRCESSYLKNIQLKTLENEDPITDSNEPELEDENIGNPEVVEEAYDPTDWKYFISKEDTALSPLEQMFMKTGWGCKSSTPASTFRDHHWIMDTDDDDDDDDDEHKKEEEKVKEQKKENN